MLSLACWLAAILVLVTSSILITAWAAARVGSPRTKWRYALLALVVNIILSILFSLTPQLINVGDESAIPILGWLLLPVQLVAVVIVMSRVFRLSFRRALAPAFAYLLCGMFWLAILAFVFHPYVCEALASPTQGMSPTIEKNDRFVANKLLGYRRWDCIVLLRHDPQPVKYCKRLVGMPGETIRFTDGNLYVNGQAVQMPAAVAGRYKRTALRAQMFKYRDDEEIKLAADEYFVIGDNVEQSADSRIYGPIHQADLAGVVDFRYWPPDRISILR